MGLVAKQSIWNTILLYAGVVIGYLNVTIFFPRVIGAEGYGLTRVLLSIVFIALQFSMLGVPTMLIKFFPRFKEEKGRGFIQYSALIVLIGLLSVASILYYFKSGIIQIKREQSELLENFYYLVLPILGAMVFHTFFSSLCRAHLKTVLPIFVYEFLFKVITAVLLGLTWYFDWSLELFLRVWALSYFLNGSILFLYLLFKRKLLLGASPKINKSFVKESMDFSLFNMMAGASNSIVANVDILMVGLLLSADSLPLAGVYAIMVYLSNAVLMPTRGVGVIASPLLAEYMENNRVQDTADLYERTSRNQMIAVGFLFIAVLVNLKSLTEFMDVPYEVGLPVFLFIGLARLVQSSTGVNGMILNYSGYYRFTAIFIGILALMTILTNYLLIPPFGLKGAALASFISITIFELGKSLFVWKKLGYNPLGKKHFIALAAGILILGIGYFLPSLDNIWLDMIYRSSLISILGVALLFKLRLSQDLVDVIEKGLSFVRPKG